MRCLWEKLEREGSREGCKEKVRRAEVAGRS